MPYNISVRVFFSFSSFHQSFPSMSITDQSVRACVLKVNVKCCSGCQNRAKAKLQSLPGVSAAEYNVQNGLMTVTGDVDPMTLVHKLTRSRKKTELVSVSYMPDNDLTSDDEDDEDDDDDDDDDEDEEDTSSNDTSSNHDPRPMQRASQVSMRPIINKKKEGMVRKYLLLGCLRSKPKVVQPFPLAKRMFGSTRFGDGNALANARRPPPPIHPQYHQMMMMMNPQFQMNGAPPMHMIQQQSGPPHNTPYHLTLDPNFKAMFPQIQPPKPDPKMLVNSGLHYSGK